MKVPLNWLKSYVDIDVSAREFAEAMTMSGSKVEGIEVKGEEISSVVVGRIMELTKHPDADRLQVSKVDAGNGILQIVTGAQNVRVGDYIPIALDGSTLPGGKKITKGKLRGVESAGMMCSAQELNLSKDDYPGAAVDGIFILEDGVHVGADIRDVLGINETVVDFEITPNRPDCLSMLGIAREAAVTFNKNLKKPEIKLLEKGDEAKAYASVEIKDPDLCPRYAARIIKDVKIAPSPKWMKDRLGSAGVRPINNIVDITNYVMLEFGQPMHAFDMRYIEESRIIVRRAGEGEIMKTLDDQERKLDSSMLVIADGKKPVAVAGVMGGANSEVMDDTKMILLESANFNGASIRLTSKKLGMRTEASSRFEKGLDIDNVTVALDRAAQLVEELGAGTVCKGVIDCHINKYESRKVCFRPDKINQLLGTSLDELLMKKIFKDLELKVLDGNVVEVPGFRLDIEREADLAEEVARFYGYNNIEATLLSGKTSTIGRKTRKQKIEDLIKDTMISCGLYETYTYSFTSPKVFDKIGIPKDSELRKTVLISNPLGEDYSIMRTTTVPDMLEVIGTNYSRRIEEAGFFELSYVYLPVSGSNRLPYEKQLLTVGMYGNTDFYSLKGVIEELLNSLGIRNYEFEPESSDPTFHPGRTASLLIRNENAGILGEIHPAVIDNFEIPEKVYIAVIEVEPLFKNANMVVEYKPLPKFPAITRDLALTLRDDIMVKEIEYIIKKTSGDILEDIRLFDVYKGRQVSEGMKSVAYSITFRSNDRTLMDEDVNKVIEKMLDELKNTLGVLIRE